jgi:hypothetical protein
MMNVRMDVRIIFVWELMCTEPLAENPRDFQPDSAFFK